MEVDDLDAMYAAIGDRLKNHWPGFTAWIISSDFDAMKRVGLKHISRETMFNGPLECRWVGYDLYEGSKENETTEVIEKVIEDSSEVNDLPPPEPVE